MVNRPQGAPLQTWRLTILQPVSQKHNETGTKTFKSLQNVFFILVYKHATHNHSVHLKKRARAYNNSTADFYSTRIVFAIQGQKFTQNSSQYHIANGKALHKIWNPPSQVYYRLLGNTIDY